MKRAIEEERYRAGEKMPSETELEKMYGVSRITIRKAIDLLKNDGYVYVKQGLGTIVASASMYNSNYVTSFTDGLRAAGYVPSAKDITISHALIPAAIAHAMDVPEDRDMICVQRLQMADGKPLCPTIFCRSWCLGWIRRKRQNSYPCIDIWKSITIYLSIHPEILLQPEQRICHRRIFCRFRLASR